MNCKLTTQEMTTHKGFQWEIGKREVITTIGGELCSPDFFHYYSDPLLAVFLNLVHADIINPRLFRVEVGGEILSDMGLKFGSKEMILTDELELPVITLIQKVAFGILCALEVNHDPMFVTWGNNWLSDFDRSSGGAVYARRALRRSVSCSANDTGYIDMSDLSADNAAQAADSATAAANATKWATDNAASAAVRATAAAQAATLAARATVAARYSRRWSAEIDLIAIANTTMTYKD